MVALAPHPHQLPLIQFVESDDLYFQDQPEVLWFHVLSKLDYRPFQPTAARYYQSLGRFNQQQAEQRNQRQENPPPSNPETQAQATQRLLFGRPTLDPNAEVLHRSPRPTLAADEIPIRPESLRPGVTPPRFAGRPPKCFFAMLNSFLGVMLAGQSPEPEFVEQKLRENPAFARCCGFTIPQPGTHTRQTDVPSLRKLQQFDQIMTDSKLWSELALDKVADNLRRGVVKAESTVVHDTTHYHAFSEMKVVELAPAVAQSQPASQSPSASQASPESATSEAPQRATVGGGSVVICHMETKQVPLSVAMEATRAEFRKNQQAQAASAQASSAETPSVETPSVETSSVETSSVETPSVETPSVETPSVETPSVETSSVETSSVETSSVETSSVETSSVETSSVNTSSVKTPSVEAPSVEAFAKSKQPTPQAQATTSNRSNPKGGKPPKKKRKSHPRTTKNCRCADRERCSHPWINADEGAGTVVKSTGKMYWAHKASTLSLAHQEVLLDAVALNDAASHDSQSLAPHLSRLFERHPDLKKIVTRVLDDGAADDSTLKSQIKTTFGIELLAPINPRRRGPIRDELPRGIDHLTPRGTPVCQAGHRFEYVGFRQSTERFLFTAPTVQGKSVCCGCPLREGCYRGEGGGRQVTIAAERLPWLDRKMPQLSKRFHKAMARRTGIERIHKLMKFDYGDDRLTKRGTPSFQARLDKTLLAMHILLAHEG